MDPLYTSERASRKRVWNDLLELDAEARRNMKEPREEGLRPPLSIIMVDRDGESDFSELLELCYSPDANRTWLCSFCGTNINDHSWASFESKENGSAVPRWQPLECSLHILFDQLAQDFFPGRDIRLITVLSHLHDRIWLRLDDLDEQMTTTSRTWINMLKQAPEKPGVKAMTIDQQLKALTGWLAICNSDTAEHQDQVHDQCHMDDDDLLIPAKRVMDLKDAKEGIVCMVETIGRKGRYMALSHCWGEPAKHPLMTVRATLEDHMAGIAMLSLPKSFQDAIKVCLHLGVRYIWIDCLCIVQDDNAEWLAEAERMAEIYSKSYLTVAATRAGNSQQGFLFDMPEDTVHYEVLCEAPWVTTDSQYRTFHATFQIDHERTKSESNPLDRRAWCLQEWYLPKRLVEFCLNDLRLICLRSVETRFGKMSDGQTKTRTIVRGFGVRDEAYFRTLWEGIREDLFKRNITRSSDKLPAMAGLAQLLEKTLHGVPNHRYLAGLWSERIAEDLSWTVLDYDATTEKVEGIPTWSWASTTAPSDFIYGRPSETFVELVEANCTGYAHPKEVSASLKVKGFVVSLLLRVDHQHAEHEDRPHLSFWFDESRAMTTTTEELQAKKKAARAEGALTSSMLITDMPICPVVHDHDPAEHTGATYFRKVTSIARAPTQRETCSACLNTGYISTVKLLLLTKTDSAYTALALSPVSVSSVKGKERAGDAESELYERVGLIEIDCIPSRQSGYMDTSDGLKVPVKTLWQTKRPASRRVITLV